MSVRRHRSIPDSELRSRPEALGSALAKAGFDGWLAFGDDRAVAGPDHIRYLSDLEPHFEPVFIAGRAGDSDAVLLTGPATIGYAAVVTKRTAGEEMIAIEAFVHPEEEYPTITLSSGRETLQSLSHGARRMATPGTGAVAATVWQR